MDPIRGQPFCGRTVSDLAVRRCTDYRPLTTINTYLIHVRRGAVPQPPLWGYVGPSPTIPTNVTPQPLDGREATAVAAPVRHSTDGRPQDRVQQSEGGGHHTDMSNPGLVRALTRLGLSDNSAPGRTRRRPSRIRQSNRPEMELRVGRLGVKDDSE